MSKHITEIMDPMDDWPEWMVVAAEQGQLWAECNRRLTIARVALEHTRILAESYTMVGTIEAMLEVVRRIDDAAREALEVIDGKH